MPLNLPRGLERSCAVEPVPRACEIHVCLPDSVHALPPNRFKVNCRKFLESHLSQGNMQQLPTELVQYVYHLATPNRKKALLQTCKQLSDCIRPAVSVARGCILHLPLPSDFRFQNLKDVLVDCSAEEAGDLFGGDLVRFYAQAKVTIHYRSLQKYRLGHLSSISGVETAIFNVRSKAEGVVACAILQGCRGLKTARFQSPSNTTFTVSCIVNDSLQRLELHGVNFEYAATPHMTSLVATVKSSAVHLRQALQLRVVVLHADTICQCTQWPPTLEVLSLCLGQATFLSFEPLPALHHLSLTNIESDIELADVPLLRHLALHDSLLGEETPVELMMAVESHSNLKSLVVHISNPDRSLQLEWLDWRDLHLADGCCCDEEIYLSFVF